jgi:hypothetical protein
MKMEQEPPPPDGEALAAKAPLPTGEGLGVGLLLLRVLCVEKKESASLRNLNNSINWQKRGRRSPLSAPPLPLPQVYRAYMMFPIIILAYFFAVIAGICTFASAKTL